MPEVYFLRRADRYRAGAAAFRTGTDEGLAEWIRLCCAAVEAGAKEATGIADAVLSAPR